MTPRVGFVTKYKGSDIGAWSGTVYRMRQALVNAGVECLVFDDIESAVPWTRLESLTSRYFSLLGKPYLRDRDPDVLKKQALLIQNKISGVAMDYLFSPSSLPVAYLNTDIPTVFWTDASFAGMLGFNPHFRSLCSRSIRHGNDAEQKALENCTLAIYASQWAADSAIRYYNVDSAKIHVVPFGANIACERQTSDIRTISESKSNQSCKLLFVGVDWYWKGGDKAVEVLRLLRKRGINAELHVVGCKPPYDPGEGVFLHGFISKSTSEGRERLNRLFRQAHFLILPTRTEAYGLVFAEASSFGLPSLGTNIGGVPTVIRDGKNGFLFELDTEPTVYCDHIEGILANWSSYKLLSLSSFAEFQRDLNWDVAGARVRNLIETQCG